MYIKTFAGYFHRSLKLPYSSLVRADVKTWSGQSGGENYKKQLTQFYSGDFSRLVVLRQAGFLIGLWRIFYLNGDESLNHCQGYSNFITIINTMNPSLLIFLPQQGRFGKAGKYLLWWWRHLIYQLLKNLQFHHHHREEQQGEFLSSPFYHGPVAWCRYK